MNRAKITIMDIARHTGLSTGTVDRVLHNRGEVSKKSHEKVLRAIRDLGYEPNVHASLLSSGKRVSIAVLIPSPESGPFWSISARGIELAAESSSTMGARIEKISYDQHDLESFREAGRRLLDMSPSGVVIAPMFRFETHLLTEQLQQRDIPYVFVDSKLEQDGYLAYFGMPMYESGYLCADQLTGGRVIDSVMIVRILSDPSGLSDPTVNRRAGFLDYIAEHCPSCDVHQVFIDPSDPGQTYRVLSECYASHPGIRHIVM
nr:LacI family transcriptional regulator [Bacteroidales bacterium]